MESYRESWIVEMNSLASTFKTAKTHASLLLLLPSVSSDVLVPGPELQVQVLWEHHHDGTYASERQQVSLILSPTTTPSIVIKLSLETSCFFASPSLLFSHWFLQSVSFRSVFRILSASCTGSRFSLARILRNIANWEERVICTVKASQRESDRKELEYKSFRLTFSWHQSPKFSNFIPLRINLN